MKNLIKLLTILAIILGANTYTISLNAENVSSQQKEINTNYHNQDGSDGDECDPDPDPDLDEE